MGNRIDAAVMKFMEIVSSHYKVDHFLLFGSRARHDFRPDSDIDVAVVIEGERGDFVGTKLAMADLAYDVLLDTGVRIQPLPIWEGEWKHPEAYPNPRLLRNIEREGIRL